MLTQHRRSQWVLNISRAIRREESSKVCPHLGIPCYWKKKEAFFTGAHTTIYQETWSVSPFSANKQDPFGFLVFGLGGIEMLTPKVSIIIKG